jgi:glutaredoxin
VSADAPAVVTLYGREGCKLCEQARERLLALRGRGGLRFALEEVDIEGDPELHRRMLERIPVVAVDGAEVCDLFLDEGALRSRIATLGA